MKEDLTDLAGQSLFSAGESYWLVHWLWHGPWPLYILAISYIRQVVDEWVKVAQSCLTLCDPMDCSPPGSSVREILQARILEEVAIPFSRGSSWPIHGLNQCLLCCSQSLYCLSHQVRELQCRKSPLLHKKLYLSCGIASSWVSQKGQNSSLALRLACPGHLSPQWRVWRAGAGGSSRKSRAFSVLLRVPPRASLPEESGDPRQTGEFHEAIGAWAPARGWLTPEQPLRPVVRNKSIRWGGWPASRLRWVRD